MASAFSIPHAKRSQKSEKTPGPGEYQYTQSAYYSPSIIVTINRPKQDYARSPATRKQSLNHYNFSIGQQKRDLSPNKSLSPGPGAYETAVNQRHVAKNVPSYSFKAQQKHETEATSLLGPGTYLPKYQIQQQRAPSFTQQLFPHNKLRRIPSGGSPQKMPITPGPGNYETNKTLFTQRGTTKFSNQKRLAPEEGEAPGPGAYRYQNALDKYMLKQSPKYHFGHRSNQKLQESPGPGQYSSKEESSLSKIGGIISRYMKSSFQASDIPGPGSYNNQSFDKLLTKNPSFSLPKSSRHNQSFVQIPGPGAYETQKSLQKLVPHSPKYMFSNQKRVFQYQSDTPGPGSYLKRLPIQKAVTIGTKLNESKKLDVPGPGAYQLERQPTEYWSKGYSVSKRNRASKVGLNTPGPGAYQTKFLGTESPKVGFPRTKRQLHSIPNLPGPGKYQIKPMFADVPKYLIPHHN